MISCGCNQLDLFAGTSSFCPRKLQVQSQTDLEEKWESVEEPCFSRQCSGVLQMSLKPMLHHGSSFVKLWNCYPVSCYPSCHTTSDRLGIWMRLLQWTPTKGTLLRQGQKHATAGFQDKKVKNTPRVAWNTPKQLQGRKKCIKVQVSPSCTPPLPGTGRTLPQARSQERLLALNNWNGQMEKSCPSGNQTWFFGKSHIGDSRYIMKNHGTGRFQFPCLRPGESWSCDPDLCSLKNGSPKSRTSENKQVNYRVGKL